MNLLMWLALLSPLLALPLALDGRWRGLALMLAPLPLAALALGGEGAVQMPLVLLGTGFSVDALNRPLLLLAGVGWSLAGASVVGQVQAHRRGFDLCWLLTLCGQAWALLGADFASFYLGYVLMTLAGYGLVVHARSAEAWRAGRIYLVLAFVGEALVLSGLLMLVAAHGNAAFADLAVLTPVPVAPVLMLAGFAVKLGIVPLHVWLPLAHPVAPVPASAVLSGVLVKAGLLGMLRFVGADAMPAPALLLALGLFTAAWGALMGLGQERLKTVLAYSTISQMGLLLAALAAAPWAGPALGLFALHHGLNKIALFLAAAHRLRGPLAQAAFLLPALSLAGLPFTSGALGKAGLKEALYAGGLPAWALGFSLSSVLTTCLLLHAWRLARAAEKGATRPHPAWLAAGALGLLLPWLWAGTVLRATAVAPATLWAALWPVLLGIALYAGWRRAGGWAWRIPEGDIVVPLERMTRRVVRTLGGVGEAWSAWSPTLPALWPDAARLDRLELAFARLPVAGLLLLAILLLGGLLF